MKSKSQKKRKKLESEKRFNFLLETSSLPFTMYLAVPRHTTARHATPCSKSPCQSFCLSVRTIATIPLSSLPHSIKPVHRNLLTTPKQMIQNATKSVIAAGKIRQDKSRRCSMIKCIAQHNTILQMSKPRPVLFPSITPAQPSLIQSAYTTD